MLPSEETVNNGTYQPLSRPIFIYVKKAAVERPEVQAFVTFYLTQGSSLVSQVGYVQLPAKAYELALARFEKRVVGSIFGSGGATVGVRIEDILAKESK